MRLCFHSWIQLVGVGVLVFMRDVRIELLFCVFTQCDGELRMRWEVALPLVSSKGSGTIGLNALSVSYS